MGATQFSGGLNMVFRGLVTDEEQFATKRYKSTGDYLYVTAGVERLQKLPADFGIFLKLDGQISDQPLISNEQYAAGGMVSVRGYKESEVLGDNALHGMAEFLAPDLAALAGMGGRLRVIPYAFYDFAMLKILEALPGQVDSSNIHATGVGIRGGYSTYFEYEVDLAVPLATTSNTQRGDVRILFLVKLQF
jgi:hemolysin activation/secretion protein